MHELLKPTDRNHFAALLHQMIADRDYDTRFGGSNKSAAMEARISPSAMGLMRRAAFPRPPLNESSIGKRNEGAVASLTRVCDTFGFDLEHCLKIFELPALPIVIARSREESSKMLTLGPEEVDMLRKQVELLGPIGWELAATLVSKFQEKSKTE